MYNKGYYDQGLGRVVFIDDHQPMGSVLDDLWKSVSGGATKAVQSGSQQLVSAVTSLPQTAKNEAIKEFLDTGAGQAVVEDAKQGWLDQQKQNVVTYYKQNKQTVNLALLGAVLALGAFIILRKPARRSAIRERVVSYIPTPAVPATPAVQAAGNARRKSRRSSKRRK